MCDHFVFWLLIPFVNKPSPSNDKCDVDDDENVVGVDADVHDEHKVDENEDDAAIKTLYQQWKMASLTSPPTQATVPPTRKVG